MTASPTSPSFSLVSVVMCTYNGEKFLREQLDSIVQQSYPIHELLIQDDQSTDRTTEIIKEYQARYPFIRLHINEKNLGSMLISILHSVAQQVISSLSPIRTMSGIPTNLKR